MTNVGKCIENAVCLQIGFSRHGHSGSGSQHAYQYESTINDECDHCQNDHRPVNVLSVIWVVDSHVLYCADRQLAAVSQILPDAGVKEISRAYILEIARAGVT